MRRQSFWQRLAIFFNLQNPIELISILKNTEHTLIMYAINYAARQLRQYPLTIQFEIPPLTKVGVSN